MSGTFHFYISDFIQTCLLPAFQLINFQCKFLYLYRYQCEYNVNYYQMLIWWFFVFYYALRHWLLWGIIYVFSSHKSVLDWQKLHGWHIFLHLILLSHLYRNRNMSVYINWHIFTKISIFVADSESNF